MDKGVEEDRPVLVVRSVLLEAILKNLTLHLKIIE